VLASANRGIRVHLPSPNIVADEHSPEQRFAFVAEASVTTCSITSRVRAATAPLRALDVICARRPC
jgi:hypothetical protein